MDSYGKEAGLSQVSLADSMYFADLDPMAQSFINACREKLLESYSTLTAAWHEGHSVSFSVFFFDFRRGSW